MTDRSRMKLGKLPPRRDPRTLRLAKYLDLSALPPAPPARSWACGVADWGMMLNDRIGDCAVAHAGHAIQAWSAANGAEITVPDEEILDAYEAISGYRPDDPSSDAGCVMLDVLNYWRQKGIGGHRIAAFADAGLRNPALVRAAINLFGGLSVGLALPLTAQSQPVWSVVNPAGPDGEPGSWGGHAVAVIGYDPNSLTCVTFGERVRMTWAFWAKYCDEAHAVLSADWAEPDKPAPSGLDLAALRADLAKVAG